MPRNTKPPDADPAAAIEAALRRLRVAPGLSLADHQTILQSAHDTFVGLYRARLRQPAIPPAFRHVGQTGARRALDTAARYLEKAADAVEALPAEAIKALADLPAGENWLQPWHLGSRNREAAALARKADTSKIPKQPVIRTRHLYVRAVATNAAYFFEMLTGQRPTITTSWKTRRASGTFVEFLTALFCLLRITANPDYAARQAARARRDRREPRHADETSEAHRQAVAEYLLMKEIRPEKSDC
jgi:hypothetical protein